MDSLINNNNLAVSEQTVSMDYKAEFERTQRLLFEEIIKFKLALAGADLNKIVRMSKLITVDNVVENGVVSEVKLSQEINQLFSEFPELLKKSDALESEFKLKVGSDLEPSKQEFSAIADAFGNKQ